MDAGRGGVVSFGQARSARSAHAEAASFCFWTSSTVSLHGAEPPSTFRWAWAHSALVPLRRGAAPGDPFGSLGASATRFLAARRSFALACFAVSATGSGSALVFGK